MTARSVLSSRPATDTIDARPDGLHGVRDFAHGTSPEFAAAIRAGGLDADAAAAAAKGGLFGRPGAFHTFEVTPTDREGLQLAYEMGPGSYPTVNGEAEWTVIVPRTTR